MRRELAARTVRRNHWVQLERPIVSFTFDDFPASALEVAGGMLSQHGVAGTYYASLKLMGCDTPTGRIFDRSQLRETLARGHELGCHTYAHCHAWETAPRLFDNSLQENRRALREFEPSASFRTFSYPISLPRPANKRLAGSSFECCRGGGQTYNVGLTDLNLLSSFFLEKSRDDFDAVRKVIQANRAANGWLVFATHDIAESPTPFGVKPDFFARTLEEVLASGATVLPVAAALDVINPRSRSSHSHHVETHGSR